MSELTPGMPLTQLSEEEQFFYQTVRDFAQEKIKPLSTQMDRDAKFDPAIHKQFFEMGLMGIDVPEKFGGAETSFFMSILAIEALSYVDASAGVMVDVQNTLVNNCFKNWGTPEQHAKYFPQLTSNKIGAYALSEAGSGSDAFALKTRAVDKGDYWELTGQKMWITNAGEAEIFIIFANIDPDKGYKGITAFIVERDFEGFSVGKKEDKLGIRASSTCELILDGCKVPKENVLGEVGKGYKVAIETLNEGRIGIGAQMVGLAQGALDAALKYTQEREQFGKTLASFQAVQFSLAQAATELEAARLLVYNAARMKDAGINFIKEAAMAKLYASQLAQKIASDMLDLFGGYGFTKEYPAEKFYRDSKIGTIYEGTSNMQLQTIAKLILAK
ncbi:MAG TPA: acyl-CoA dehydrogenase [Caldithrix abyssi]|uniref:Short/branched chain specific acyl-CoA dehydrogenase, mitochondrial n=1 Tax=Caldithrix abyssi TaxID=187145 RepID=A0A7V4U239_CALAY|nr:acyl-CoA dehydrogenase [Caldithrix abyssi]